VTDQGRAAELKRTPTIPSIGAGIAEARETWASDEMRAHGGASILKSVPDS